MTRLKDLHIEPYLYNATINCILSQRLYRKTCEVCSGKGCPDCDGEGFSGRSAIFEFFSPLTNEHFEFQRSIDLLVKDKITDPEELSII